MLILFALQIDWKADLESALAQAGKDGRPVLLHFVKAGSEACGRMEKDTFGDASTAAFSMKTFTHVRLDVTLAGALASRHGVAEVPCTLILNPAGERIAALSGYLGPQGYREGVESALAAWGKLQALEPRLKAAPADGLLLAEAAGLYVELGEGRKAAAAYRKAGAASPDPKARGAFLAKALNQLNALEAEEAVTAELLSVAADLDAIDPKLGFADDAAYARAMADYNHEDWDEAIKKLEDLAAKWPEGDRAAPALLGLGDLYHHAKKDHKKAIARIQRVLDKYPRTEWAERARHVLEHIKAHAEQEK